MVNVVKEFRADHLIEELRERCANSAQTIVAEQLGISGPFLNQLLSGRREMTDRVARAMGYTREIVFRKKAA